MLDPQRNLLTVILVAVLGVLGVGAVAQMFVLGRADIDRIAASGSGAVDEVQVDVPETGLADFEQYSGIMERPVFFSDRRLPVVEVADRDGADDIDIEPIEPEEEVSDLRAGVAGIVITPEMKLAMVRDDAAGKTFVLREGMSLEGEQAAWMIETIQPREVSFVSVDGRRTGLELKVHTSGLTVETPRPTSRLAQREADAEERPDEPGEASREAEEVSDEARARAEEIRRRVAERRAELRAEAERRARQQQRQDNDG
jgi:hypothetical protein